MSKRLLDIVVVSDVHLGTVGCHAEELAQYLNSIETRVLVLNGDFIDIWNFKKYYWPEAHMVVIRTLLNMMTNGTEIYYLTGNHDEVLRKVSIRFIDNFETTAIELAIDQGYDYVVCGHIHQPKILGHQNEKGSVIYMNSGDWIENLTSLEYDGAQWSVYRYDESHFTEDDRDLSEKNRNRGICRY